MWLGATKWSSLTVIVRGVIKEKKKGNSKACVNLVVLSFTCGIGGFVLVLTRL